jgi:uncharacterized protein (DUF697 family)
MAPTKQWVLMPQSHQDIDALEKKCRRLVSQRAVLAAGVAVVPLPGVDIMTDIGLFSMLFDDINSEFGLTPAQIAMQQRKLQLLTYEALAAVGSLLVGKLMTRELVLHVLRRSGAKMLARQAVKFLPLAGQALGAAVSFAAFRTIGNQHVAACAAVARRTLG